jgi:hypothetical protein
VEDVGIVYPDHFGSGTFESVGFGFGTRPDLFSVRFTEILQFRANLLKSGQILSFYMITSILTKTKKSFARAVMF